MEARSADLARQIETSRLLGGGLLGALLGAILVAASNLRVNSEVWPIALIAVLVLAALSVPLAFASAPTMITIGAVIGLMGTVAAYLASFPITFEVRRPPGVWEQHISTGLATLPVLAALGAGAFLGVGALLLVRRIRQVPAPQPHAARQNAAVAVVIGGITGAGLAFLVALRPPTADEPMHYLGLTLAVILANGVAVGVSAHFHAVGPAGLALSLAILLGWIEDAADARTSESYEALLAYYGSTGGWASLVAAVVIVAAGASVSSRRAFADRHAPTES